MSDPLAGIIGLLKPGAPYSKLVHGVGAWRVRRAEVGCVYYCMTLAGRARLEAPGTTAITLEEGDFVLIPSAQEFTMSSVDPVPPDDVETQPVLQEDGSMRLGDPGSGAEVQQLVGYCRFGSGDAQQLTSLLPTAMVVRGEDRIYQLVWMIREETRANRPAGNVILEHLLQILLIEAVRCAANVDAPPGVLKGIGDPQLAPVLHRIHAEPEKQWTAKELSDIAHMSRSTLFAKFTATVGIPPMEYLTNWRMSLAKDFLCKGNMSLNHIAERIGYASSSAFSSAFSRHVGWSPAAFAKLQAQRDL